jgi:hypothetical protein
MVTFGTAAAATILGTIIHMACIKKPTKSDVAINVNKSKKLTEHLTKVTHTNYININKDAMKARHNITAAFDGDDSWLKTKEQGKKAKEEDEEKDKKIKLEQSVNEQEKTESIKQKLEELSQENQQIKTELDQKNKQLEQQQEIKSQQLQRKQLLNQQIKLLEQEYKKSQRIYKFHKQQGNDMATLIRTHRLK